MVADHTTVSVEVVGHIAVHITVSLEMVVRHITLSYFLGAREGVLGVEEHISVDWRVEAHISVFSWSWSVLERRGRGH